MEVFFGNIFRFICCKQHSAPHKIQFVFSLAPAFDKLIATVHDKTGFPKAAATSVVVVCVDIIGTISYLFFGLLLETKLATMPLLP